MRRDADLFLCEATLDEPEPEAGGRGHLTAAEAATRSASPAPVGSLVIHRPDELPLADGLERAHDGLELTL